MFKRYAASRRFLSLVSTLWFALFAQVLVHEGISFDRELYFAIIMDRAYNGPVIIASRQGMTDDDDDDDDDDRDSETASYAI